MTHAEVLAKLSEIVGRVVYHEVSLQSSTTAHDVKGWDSLAQISIVIFVEQEYKIRFRMGEVAATRNVGEFADLILRYRQKAESHA